MLLLILRNILITTIISFINFCGAIFNSTLQQFSQWLWLPLEMRLSKLSSASHTKLKGSFNYYVLTKWPKSGPPASPPCLHLFDFGNPSFCKLPPPPHPLPTPFKHCHYPIVKSCYFIDSWTPVIISTKMSQKIFPYECSQYSHKYKWCLLLRLRYE